MPVLFVVFFYMKHVNSLRSISDQESTCVPGMYLYPFGVRNFDFKWRQFLFNRTSINIYTYTCKCLCFCMIKMNKTNKLVAPSKKFQQEV